MKSGPIIYLNKVHHYNYLHAFVKVKRYLEELVFQWSKGANQVSKIIGDDNDLPSAGVLWSQHGQSPSNHSNLG